MRAPASLLAIPLLVGVAAGLRFFETQHLPLCAAAGAVLALVAGIAAFADGGDAECLAAVVLGSLLCGLSLGADAARRVYSPSLLPWFTNRADFSPVILDGTLREDAAAGPLACRCSWM